MTSRSVPSRILRAAELLDLQGDEHVLDLGAGNGVAAALLLDRFPRLTYTAVDRSSTAVRRATDRNADAIAAGRLTVQQSDIESFVPERGGRGATTEFDVVVAINVNVFWTDAPVDSVDRLCSMTRPGGRWLLAYEGPNGAPDGRIGDRVGSVLERGGLVLGPGVDEPDLLVVRAHRPS